MRFFSSLFISSVEKHLWNKNLHNVTFPLRHRQRIISEYHFSKLLVSDFSPLLESLRECRRLLKAFIHLCPRLETFKLDWQDGSRWHSPSLKNLKTFNLLSFKENSISSVHQRRANFQIPDRLIWNSVDFSSSLMINLSPKSPLTFTKR